MYNPREFLAEDLIRLVLNHRWEVAVMHLWNRGWGMIVADLVVEMLEVGQEKFSLPDEFYQELAPIKTSDTLEIFFQRWSVRSGSKKQARVVLY
jgi:hypothetical protein